ncbi:MAG: hypothetical protein HY738_13240, partial [Bacteroidia bacterium]|nr:hypothetical protein [Bacteroidia bacterium]
MDLDADPTNELQYLSYSNDTIYLSNGNFTVLPHDFDKDSTNEIQQLSINNDTIFISKTNSIILPPEVDGDTTNEIQHLSYNNDTLSIENGNSVFLPLVNNYAFPDGYMPDSIVFNDTIIVPQGFNLYLTGAVNSFKLNGDNYSVDSTFAPNNFPVIIPENSVVTETYTHSGFLLIKARIEPMILKKGYIPQVEYI